MKITFLGTGTSTGVPAIGCDCDTCQSSDPRDKRFRSSVLVGFGGKNVLIDSTPDLRMQVLNNNVKRLDAILFTHSHADHIFGLDDIRRFCLLQKGAVPCYASSRCAGAIRRVFDYALIEKAHLQKSFCPLIELHEVSEAFELFGQVVQPIPLIHADEPILGFRLGKFAYCTDCSKIEPKSMDKLRGLDVLVLGALRTKPHRAHLSISQAVEIARELGARRTFFIHMGHSIRHEVTSGELPGGIELAYDGLSFECGIGAIGTPFA